MGKIVIHVEGGLVQAVYSDRAQEVEVFDLDLPSYPSEVEILEFDSRAQKLKLEQDGLTQIY